MTLILYTTGRIPHQISNCSNLQELNLGHNQFTGSIPGSIGTMKNMKNMLLGGNAFRGAGEKCGVARVPQGGVNVRHFALMFTCIFQEKFPVR